MPASAGDDQARLLSFPHPETVARTQKAGIPDRAADHPSVCQ